MAELIPAPFPSLLRRILAESRGEAKVFDLPARKFWRGSTDLDLSVRFHGRAASNPVGPAAGPQDQMSRPGSSRSTSGAGRGAACSGRRPRPRSGWTTSPRLRKR